MTSFFENPRLSSEYFSPFLTCISQLSNSTGENGTQVSVKDSCQQSWEWRKVKKPESFGPLATEGPQWDPGAMPWWGSGSFIP